MYAKKKSFRVESRIWVFVDLLHCQRSVSSTAMERRLRVGVTHGRVWIYQRLYPRGVGSVALD
jgi:hypothetical protein